MGKSIRSKQKRKHRAEFRNTIGTEAYEKNMAKTQVKLREGIEKQTSSMESLERLSKQLGNSGIPEPQNFEDMNKSNSMAVEDDANATTPSKGVADALETTTARVVDKDQNLKGENKAPKRKTRRGRKYSYMHHAKGESKKLEKEKPKPRFFCQF